MNAITAIILQIADAALEGGRQQLFREIAPLMQQEIFLSAASVAKRYDVSLQTVKHWRREGKLTPSLKIKDGTARYTLADLEKFQEITGRKEVEQVNE